MASIADIRSIINAKDGTTEGDAVELSEDLVEAEKAKKEKKVVDKPPAPAGAVR